MGCADTRVLISRQLDGSLSPAEEQRLRRHISGCRACAAFARGLAEDQRLLAEHWTPAVAPAGFASRVSAALPPRVHRPDRARHGRFTPRLVPAAAAVVGLALLGTLAVPATRAGVGEFVRTVFLRETTSPPTEQRIGTGFSVRLEEARQAVPWPVLTPRALPDGYRLAAVQWGEVHAFADGPTVVLTYTRDGRPDAAPVRVVQLRTRPGARPDEPVVPGAVSTVRAGGRDAVLIDGEWQTTEQGPRWQRGALLRLLLEDGDRVIWLEADPRDGWDGEKLVHLAESLR
jgi:putative zinc finger protein